jgi:4-amino-4-deoxy-L-arabinose transferase-like glycosyltransferase
MLNHVDSQPDAETGMSIKRGLGYLETLSDFLNQEMKRVDRRLLLGLLILAFLIRIPLLIYPEVIHVDGVLYVRHARQILSWDWSVGRTHPFYPTLIALFHFLTPTDEMAGIWVSVIFGALLVLPVFYLGKAIFNEKVGSLAALIATVHPFLYTPSGSVLSESIFHFLLATSVLFGWYAFQEGRFKDIFLFGLLASLSYLTRPEGIGFLFVFAGWVLWVNPLGERRRWTKKTAIILLAFISFLVFSFPYFLQLKKDTGRWQISNKIAISMGSLSAEETSDAIEKIRETKKITFSSFIKSPIAVAKKIGAGTLISLYQFQQVFNPLLTVILVWGLLLSKGRSLSLKVNLYVISYIVYLLCIIHPLFRVNRRYTSHVISICLPWAAFGFIEIAEWVRKKWRNETLQKRVPAFLLIAISIILFVQGRWIHPREQRFIQREAGYWMGDHLPKESKVMAAMPQEAFYSGMTWVRIPAANVDKIFEEARSKEVHYLVVDEEIEAKFPGFVEKAKEVGFSPLKEWRREEQWTVLLQAAYP